MSNARVMKAYLFIIIFLVIFSFAGCKVEPSKNIPSNTSSILSFNTNPSGNWQVGYSTGNVLEPSQFSLCTSVDTSHIIGIWHPASGQPGYYPYTGQNHTDSTQLDPTGSWAGRPGEIVMEGSNSGQYSMLKFTVPAAGKYRVKVVFEGVHFRISTTDVHVLLNAQSLFADSINGYGGDSLFHAIEGPRPTTTFNDTLILQQNDVITFAVGYGPDKTNFNDTTGLLIYLELIA